MRCRGVLIRGFETVAAVSATPTSHRVSKPAVKAAEPEPVEDELIEEEEARPSGPPLWLQFVTLGRDCLCARTAGAVQPVEDRRG